MLTFQAIRERLRASLWFVPALFAIGAIVAALAVLTVDHSLSSEDRAVFFLYGGTADGARSVLSTIAQSMLTFTGLVFTITMLVLQLASSQLSPRVMRTFLRDRGNQIVLGLFVATFLFTLVVLRDVRSDVVGQSGFVPGLAVWSAFALLLASVAAFIYYINHMAHAIRASTVIASIAAETEGAIDRLFPDRLGEEPPAAPEHRPFGRPDLVLKARRAGVVIGVHDARLEASAKADGRLLELVPAVGDFVPVGAPLARLWGQWDREAADEVREAIAIGAERTLQQDAAFGFRQLVDVAVRALSPGTNDPSTAVQALDRLHDLLRRLADRDIPSPLRSDESGRLRMILPRPGWDDYVELAVDEIRLAGGRQVQVLRRLRYLLEDLLSVAPDDRAAVVRRELGRLETAEALFTEASGVLGDGRPSARGHALSAHLPRWTPRT